MILSFPLYGKKTLMPICEGDELHMRLISHLMDNGIPAPIVKQSAKCLMALIHADDPSGHSHSRQSNLHEYYNH
jgi:hypothetical protein